MNKILENLILFLCGALILSPFSSFFTLVVLHLSFNAVDVFLLPFIPFLIKKFHMKIKLEHFVIFLFFMLIWMLISFAVDIFSVYGICSNVRTYLIAGLFFLASYNNDDFDLEGLEWIAWGSSVTWVFFAVNLHLRFFPFFIMSTSTDDVTVYGNVLAPCFLLFSTLFRGKRFEILLVVFLMILISLFAGIRRAIAVFIFSFGLVFFYAVVSGRKRVILPLLFLVGTSFFVFFASEKYIREEYPMLHLRVYMKTFGFFGQGGRASALAEQSDDTRRENLLRLFEDPGKKIFPLGFVSKQTLSEPGCGAFIDCPLLEFVHTLGWPLFLLLLLVYIKKCLLLFRYFKQTKRPDPGILFAMACVIFFLLFLDGMIFSFIYIAPFVGCILGRIFSDSGSLPSLQPRATSSYRI